MYFLVPKYSIEIFTTSCILGFSREMDIGGYSYQLLDLKAESKKEMK